MTYSIVQSLASNVLDTTGLTATGGPNHSLIVCINSYETSSTPVVNSVKLGIASLLLATSVVSASGWSSSHIYYLSGIASGQTEVIVDSTNEAVGSTTGGVDVYEIDKLIALDKTSTGSATTGSSWSSGATAALTDSDEIAFGTAAFSTFQSASGWTYLSGGGSNRKTGYKLVTDKSAQTFNGTSFNRAWSAAVATFMPALAKSGATAAIASML